MTHTESSDEFGDVEFIGYLGGSYDKFYGEISGVTTSDDDIDFSAKAGAAYGSPFVGRLDDNSIAGLQLIKDIDEVFRVQAIHKTRILSASIRYVNSVSQSFANGADIVTMPPAVFDKMYNHVLTDKGLEIFENDWKSTQTV